MTIAPRGAGAETNENKVRLHMKTDILRAHSHSSLVGQSPGDCVIYCPKLGQLKQAFQVRVIKAGASDVEGR